MLVLAGQLLQPKVHNLMVVVMHLQELLQYKQHIHFKLFGSGQNINASYGHSYNADNIPMPLSAGGSFFLVSFRD
ncbi:hypothetical protein DR84_1952 [Francisella tularensis]|nr:hypothetical protein DR84_1952 [Francisella tularensis]